LFARYDTHPLPSGSGYQFTTSEGDIYIAYFTEFTLLDSDQNEILATPFGFTNKNTRKTNRFDVPVRNTIVHLIMDFFEN